MLRYTLKRLLLFIPTFIGVSILVFLLSTQVPGDPVKLRAEGGKPGDGTKALKKSSEEEYEELRERMGLDAPLFYFSINDRTIPDTLYRIPDPRKREQIRELAWEYGAWEQVQRFVRAREQLLEKLRRSRETSDKRIETRRILLRLIGPPEQKEIARKIKRIGELLERSRNSKEYQELKGAFAEMKRNSTPFKRYIPDFDWHGAKNRYHIWFFGDRPWFGKENPDKNYSGYGVIRGDLGHSYFSGRPVGGILFQAFGETFLFGSISIVLVYGLSLLIGVFTATRKGIWGQSLQGLMLLLYSVPEFWVGTLLIVLLSNPDILNLFPSAYTLMEIPEGGSWWQGMLVRIEHMILPLLCFTYGSLAYLSRQLKGGLEEVLSSDFMRTPLAMGVPEGRRVRKYALKNALLPFITLFGTVLPYLLSGSVIIETIFSIQGLGRTSYQALMSRDYPVIFSMLLFSTFLTMLGTLLSDLLYAWADPRITHQKGKEG